MNDILTQDITVFLQHEFEFYYNNFYDTYEEFAEVMSVEVRRCWECKILYWCKGARRCNHKK